MHIFHVVGDQGAGKTTLIEDLGMADEKRGRTWATLDSDYMCELHFDVQKAIALHPDVDSLYLEYHQVADVVPLHGDRLIMLCGLRSHPDQPAVWDGKQRIAQWLAEAASTVNAA